MFAADTLSDAVDPALPRGRSGRSLYACCGACGGVLAIATAVAFIVLVLNA